MSTIVTRSGKGSPLTNTEVDANFTNLNTGKAELSGAVFTGAITTNSTIDGRDVAADGVTADAALPKAGGAMTGAITTNSTFDGVDIATRDAVLTSTTTTANAALPKAGGAVTGDISFGDSDKAIFGAGNDFEIYFNGNHGVVRTASASVGGNIYIQDDNNIVLGSIGGENYLNAAKDGAVTAYYDNAPKLATTSTGIDVTGTATMDGLVSGGTAFVNLTSRPTGVPATAGALWSAQTETGNYGIVSKASSTDSFTYIGNTGSAATLGTSYGSSGSYLPLDLQTSDKKRLRIAANGDISFYEDTGTTPKLFWDASAESLGIGTSSPLSILHIGTGADANLPITLAPASGGNVEFRSTTSTGSFTFTNANGASEKMRIDSSGQTTITSTAAIPLKVAYNSTNYMAIGHEFTNVVSGGVGHIFKINNTQKMLLSASGLDVTGTVTIPDYVIHDGNTSTKFGFGSANTMNFISNGSDRLTIANSYAVFNDAGTDYDFRVESDGNDHMLFVDGGTNRVGVGKSAPNAKLEIGGVAAGEQAFLIESPRNDALSNGLARINITDVNCPFTGLQIDHAGTGLALDVNGTAAISGGVYLGGTGAANKLSDFEFGTWTPVLGSSVGSSGAVGTYTKIGDRCFFTAEITMGASSNTGHAYISLPFAASSSASNTGGASIAWTDYGAATYAYILPSYARFYVRSVTGAELTYANVSLKTFRFSGSIIVA